MTVPGPSRPLPPQESAHVLAEQVLGPLTATRLATFGDGGLYVKAGRWARFLAWLVDVVVFVLGIGVGVIVVSGVYVAAGLDEGTILVSLIAVLFLMQLLYGTCYRNGRALGAVLTGTQLVRLADGGRIGRKAPWAMLVRILMPLLVIGMIVGAFGGGGNVADPTVRVSVDTRATRQLRDAGIT
ncbi:RDD family protein [Pseudonocardia sp. DSM 110487]|uniref:RDD family protein n=1 Tax=Pseudonocardia sp. DSM 110487 TaxID=2865833 RepID=UPI0021033C8B|nr:RDD family protein [Pseudonocardia sp. DSM 110487]